MTPPSVLSPARVALGNTILIALLLALAGWLLFLHVSGEAWSDPGWSRWLAAMGALGIWLGFTIGSGWRRRRAEAAHALPVVLAEGVSILIVYASQTGTAEHLATQTAQSLQTASMPVRLMDMEQLDAEALCVAGRVLFVVSTTGEGDAPDSAARFVRQCMQGAAIDLAGLQYGLLALGDSDYEDFCGFGRRLQHWLQSCAAQPLFDPVEVNNGDPAALRHWQHHLALLSGASEMPDWQQPKYRRWRLLERHLLNPDSAGGSCFHLALTPFEGGPLVGDSGWQAGDLVEIGPQHTMERVTTWLSQAGFNAEATTHVDGAPMRLADLLAHSHLPVPADVRGESIEHVIANLQALPHREYSIASIPADGSLHLLVRQMRREDGSLGLGSGWLTERAALGAGVALRIRANPNFHQPEDARPLILIGNGTGLAGLRALLKARIAGGHKRHWLIFGERQSARDFYYRGEIERWHATGYIERLDLAWSRDQAERIHVQQRLHAAAEELRRWIDDGAAIYVCGSLAGMAPGVDAVLREVLGAAKVEQLRGEGRYRRDVY